MIHIDRHRLDDSGDPIRPSNDWFCQGSNATNAALINRFAAGFDFKDDVYGHDAVRAALRCLFYDKCAYCEYSLARTDMNIEHYRPKGRVAEADDHPGYYWLAYEWDNLLPSCTFCNQKRKDPPTWPNLSRGPTMGKSDQFPLKLEANRAWHPADNRSLEQPALINPCVDDPSQHLTFDITGKPIALDWRGEKTIEICNLDQSNINWDREQVIRVVAGLIEFLNQLPAGQKKDVLDRSISNFMSDNRSYAGAARAVAKNPQDFGVGVT